MPSPQFILREEIKTIRKSTVLAEFEQHGSPQKTEVPCSNDQEYNLLPNDEKVKRFLGKDGHVVKLSTLNDFGVAVSSIFQGMIYMMLKFFNATDFHQKDPDFSSEDDDDDVEGVDHHHLFFKEL